MKRYHENQVKKISLDKTGTQRSAQKPEWGPITSTVGGETVIIRNWESLHLTYNILSCSASPEGFSTASNRYIAEAINCSEKSVGRWIDRLAELGVVSVDRPDGGPRRVFLLLTPKEFGSRFREVLTW